MSLALINLSISADEAMPLQIQSGQSVLEFQAETPVSETETEITIPEDQSDDQQEPTAVDTSKTGPRVSAKFYSANAILAIPRLKKLAGQEPEYNKIIFKLEGFPKHQEIHLEIKRLASEIPTEFEHKVSFSISADGSLLISNSDQRLQNLISSSHGFLPGERVVYRFRTADGTISKDISGVPTPAVVKDKDHKVVLKANLVSINPTVYQIILPGLEEGEQYDFKSTSLGETTKAKPKYVKNKPFLYSPSANNKSKGSDAILEIRRKSGQTYSIRLPWGTALEGYQNEKKIYSSKP
ncbi:MAG TPA: hypothetical protein VGP47_06145 [Parachlamydiaceae bacterium]|nr:hypothetical protein [Parachlamydiaceae bacterium]